MEHDELTAALEAVLFISGDALAIKDIAGALETTPLELSAAADTLRLRFDEPGSGLSLIRVGDTLQLSTKPSCAPYIERVLSPVQRQPLSLSAMETLSIIAYRQPITRPEIETLRGVMSGHAVRSLLDKGLICEIGRKDAVGRPILYGTTEDFLRHFGIATLDELPTLEADMPVFEQT